MEWGDEAGSGRVVSDFPSGRGLEIRHDTQTQWRAGSSGRAGALFRGFCSTSHLPLISAGYPLPVKWAESAHHAGFMMSLSELTADGSANSGGADAHTVSGGWGAQAGTEPPTPTESTVCDRVVHLLTIKHGLSSPHQVSVHVPGTGGGGTQQHTRLGWTPASLSSPSPGELKGKHGPTHI